MDEDNYEEFELSSSIAVLMNCSPIKTWKKERHFVFDRIKVSLYSIAIVNHRHTNSTVVRISRDVERKKLKYVAFFSRAFVGEQEGIKKDWLAHI